MHLHLALAQLVQAWPYGADVRFGDPDCSGRDTDSTAGGRIAMTGTEIISGQEGSCLT